MRRWFKTAAIVLPALAIAGASASAAMSSVLAGRLPEQAVNFPLVDAEAYVNLAVDSAIDAGAADDDPNRTVATLAMRAFRREPTSSKAISALAVERQVSGDYDGAQLLYADALLLAPRNRVANLALIESGSRRGALRMVLDRYDVLLRTGGMTSEMLFDVLATALREPAMVPHADAILARDPPWARTFWLKVAQNDPAIANVGQLRLRQTARGRENPAGNDAAIVGRLVGAGELDLAYRLFRAVTGPDDDGNAYLRNGSFDRAPEYAPFDWATYSDARYGADVDAAAGSLVVFAESPSDSLVARQLVKLPAGDWRLSVALQDTGEAAGTALTVAIRCATSANGQRIPVESDSVSAIVRHRSGCPFSYVEVFARKIGPASEIAPDVVIDSIALTPAGGDGPSQLRSER